MTQHLRSVRRRLAACLALIVAVILPLAGCAEQGSAAQAADAPVLVEQHQTFITLQNRAGLPLVDVRLAVVPYSRTEFSKILNRFESGERRDVMMSELSSRDGTTFSPRLVKAKSLKITASDIVGKRYEVEVPWE
ncbi:MAG: hypothetical protein AB7I13_02415 [Vicinamibacterales bacterium]